MNAEQSGRGGDGGTSSPERAPAATGVARRFRGCGCVGCLGLSFFVAMATLVVVAVPSPVALGLATAAAVAPVPLFVFLVLQLDRYEREPWRVLVSVFLWGALVATFASALLNDLIGGIIAAAFGEMLGEVITASAVAPIVEETAKGVALLLLLVILRREFDNVLDGIVYGSLVGIGFAMTENVLYFGRVYLEGGLVGLGVLFYVRIILGGFGHALYTATTGAALGFARERGSRLLAVVVPPLGYGLAILQHAAWNFIAGTLLPSVLPELDPFLLLFVVLPLESLFLTGPGLLTLLLIALCAWRRESTVIRRHLAEEAARGTLTRAEYEALPSQRARLGRELEAFKRRGVSGWLAERELHQVATKLAFRKWHVSRGERPTAAERLTTEDHARAQIAALRARAS